MNSYKESFVIKSYETDRYMRLKPVSFMNLSQDLAEKHSDIMHFGYNDLISQNAAWVLSRLHIKFLKYPTWKERVTMETWHKGSDKLFGIRDFQMSTLDGEPLILATSLWLIIDTKTRRIRRTDSFINDGMEGSLERDAIKERAERISRPQELHRIGTRDILFSDIDLNGHTNNAKYIEWSLDYISKICSADKVIKEMTVNFNSESREGETIDINTANSDNSIYIEGERAGTSVFQAVFNY